MSCHSDVAALFSALFLVGKVGILGLGMIEFIRGYVFPIWIVLQHPGGALRGDSPMKSMGEGDFDLLWHYWILKKRVRQF